MNWSSWLLWGFASTVVLTSILAGSQGVSLTRMNIPYLLVTIFTPNRDRAKFIGFFLHFANGWIFSLIYVAAFQVLHKATWWLGAGVGLVHGIFCSHDGASGFACVASANGQRTIWTNCCAPTRAARFPRSALWHSYADFGSPRTRHFWRDPGRILRREMKSD